MLNKLNHNQKGITLVELLAAIVILGLVTTIASVMIVRSLDIKDVAQDNISLKQDTNVLINDLRRQFHEGNGTKICFNHTANGLVVDIKTEVFSIGKPNKDEKLGEVRNTERIKLPISNGCITNNNKTSLEINLVTKNKSEKPLEIKTTFVNNSEGASIVMNGGKQDGITLYYKVDKLPCNSEDVRKKLNLDREKKNKKPIAILNIGWDAEEVETGCPGKTHLIKHNLNIYEQLDDHNNLNLQVGRNLYTKQIETSGNSTFNVIGNFYTEQMDTYGNSTFIVGGDIQTKQLTTHGSTEFRAGGNIYTEQMDIYGNTKFNTGGDLNTKDLTTHGNGTFDVGRNLYTEQLTINSNSNFTVQHDAIFKDEVEITGNSSVVIGNVTNGGNAYFKDQFDLLNNSKFIVWGKTNFSNGKDINIKGTLCSVGGITPIEYANKSNCK